MTKDASRPHGDWRRGGRALRIGLAVTLIGKLALVAVWYGGGVQGALAAEPRGARSAEATPPQGNHGTAEATTKPGGGPAGDTNVHGDAEPRQLASLDRAVVDGTGKPPTARALVEAIIRRQAELDNREHELAAREERLHVFEQDVIAKIASLEEIEKRLQGRAKAASAAVDAANESLAKVYGAMKPADAAPILERLDEATVLSIFGRMKEKQIGEILPLMTKDKAIALTHALATSPPR